MSDKVYVGLCGFHSDAKTVLDKIMFRKNLYELRENRSIKPKVLPPPSLHTLILLLLQVLATIISNLAYQHRFGSFFTEPLVAGLDPVSHKVRRRRDQEWYTQQLLDLNCCTWYGDVLSV